MAVTIEEFFPKSTEINQTYTTLENIDGLLRSYIADGHVAEIILNCNEILQVSFEYERDMNLYESLVIRQPLQRIIRQKNFVESYKKQYLDNKCVLYFVKSGYDKENVINMWNNWLQYDRTHATDTIIS